MGIDFVVSSTIEPDYYVDKQEKYLKYAWRDLQWEKILELASIQLYLLYDHAINYWSVDQVSKMHERLKILYGSPESILPDDGGYVNDAIALREEIKQLIGFFEEYVEKKAIIEVF
jgi:hypothetical protein